MHLFRNVLILSVSAISLALQARAAEISTSTSTPVRTSVAEGGQPGDIEITENGSIETSDAPGFTAVTIDSANDVTIDGSIEIEESDNSTGVLILPGLASNLTLSGTVTLLEDYSREDLDDDDDDDGPLAVGTGRYGVLLEDGAAMTGAISLLSDSSVQVEGNASAGVLLRSALAGDLTANGTIIVTGDAAQGLTAEQRIDGDVTLNGAVSATGAGATGVRLDEGATGAVVIGGSITSTGFANGSLSNYVAPASVTDDTDPLEERADPDELYAGQSALVIGASLGQGLLVNGAVADPDLSDDEDDDETKDTIEDFNENRQSGRISTYGSAPALLISADWNGPATEDLVLGAVTETVRDTLDDDDDDDTDEVLTQFNYDYGLINRGSIGGVGTNVGFTGTGILIEGSAATGYSAIISGGIYNSGSITATAYEADAWALRLGANTLVPLLTNDGIIQAVISTETLASAVAVDLSATASLDTLVNSGSIIARSTGNAGTATGVLDRSGTLETIVNTGTISAGYVSDGIDLTLREDAVALDLTANTTGVTLRQFERAATYDANNDDEIDARDTLDPSITGSVLFGSGDDTLRLEAGSLTGDVAFGAGSNSLYASDTDIDGNISFSGASSVAELLNGATLTGDIAFGGTGTTSSLQILSGSTYSGRLTNAGSALDIVINASRARLEAGSSVTTSSLDIRDGASLILEIDPAEPAAAPIFMVSGTASLSGGVTIAPVFSRVIDTGATYTLIEAGNLVADLASGDVSLTSELPFMYQTDLVLTEGAASRLDLVYRLKTAGELGLDINQSAAFAPVLELLEESSDLSAAFAGISTASGFEQAYDQLLPQRTDASGRFLRAQSTAAFGALADQMALLAASPGEGARTWLQESFTFSDIGKSEGVPGYNGSGFSVAGGIDIPTPSLDAFGVMINFSSGRYEQKTGGSNPVSTTATGIGLYGLKTWDNAYVRGAGQVSRVNLSSLRELDIISGERDNFRDDADVLDSQDISDTMTADWGGYSYAASASTGATFKRGSFYLRPELTADYFRLDQEAYRETALLNTNLALELSDAVTERASASAVLALGTEWDIEQGVYRIFPEARLGVRHELFETPYETSARFHGQDESFDIVSQEEFGDSLIAGFSFNSSSYMFTARVSYDVELSRDGAVHYVGASGVLKF